MIEVRWVGRGGYGVVTVSDILAKAAVIEGKYSQHIPMFGPERAGAPVYASTRISEEPIELHSEVYSPDIAIIIDPRMSTEDTVIRNTGLKRDGTLLLNTKSIPSDVVEIVQENNYTLYYVDAYTIAMVQETILQHAYARSTSESYRYSKTGIYPQSNRDKV